MGAVGKGSKPVLLAQSPLLEGADGMAFNAKGDLWVAVNELNAIVSVSPAGAVKMISKNASQGPLEFPSALVFVRKRAYISNFDTPRRDNMDANGTSAKDGVGASIAQISHKHIKIAFHTQARLRLEQWFTAFLPIWLYG